MDRNVRQVYWVIRMIIFYFNSFICASIFYQNDKLNFKGLVVDNKVDFAVSKFAVRDYRAKVIDYLVMQVKPSVGRFVIKNPNNVYDWTVFFQPLYQRAWVGLVLFSFSIPILISFIAFFRKQLITKNKDMQSIIKIMNKEH